MKSKLPLLILGIGLMVVVAAMVMRGRGAAPTNEEEDVPELPFSQRPYTSLVPTEDGHYLNLVIKNISVPSAASMDYELYYDTADGITQGVPGKVNLEGKNSVERELLLGSESSGKYRYDEGVDDGTLTLRFRDSSGKLIGKVAGQWVLSSGASELKSLDGKLTYTLEEVPEGTYFVVMPTFGLPSSASFEVANGPYGIFASSSDSFPGSVSLAGATINYFNGTEWSSLSGSSEDIGVFVSSN